MTLLERIEDLLFDPKTRVTLTPPVIDALYAERNRLVREGAKQ